LKKLKPRHKRRIFWFVLSAFAAVALGLVIIPPFINLNNMKPMLESTIIGQTGMDAKIEGNINFSLLGRATIIAHDIKLPNGTIDTFGFEIPVSKLFNLQSANLSGSFFVSGANLSLDSLSSPNFKNRVEIKNSVFHFMNKDFKIINGILYNGLLNGTVRADGHKYDFYSNGDEFDIKNKTDELEISGRLYSDGSASGTLSVNTDNPNILFNFSEPKIHKSVKLTTKFEWNGKSGFRFYDINGGDFTGEIKVSDDGHREITLYSDNINFDISFLLKQTSVFFDTKFDLDLRGNLKLGNRMFKHIQVQAMGTKSKLEINKIIADDIVINGGEINVNGAQDLGINMKLHGTNTFCKFSGDWENWNCSEFKHGDYYGNISVHPEKFEMFIKSDKNMPEKKVILKELGQLGKTGLIKFEFADAGGTIELNDSVITPHYEFVKNKTLLWMGIDLKFLPEYLIKEPGDFTWTSNDLFFEPNDGKIKLTIGPDYFSINGNDIKDWFPKSDLRFLNDNMAYTVSGNYHNSNISDLKIKVAGHIFTGSVIDNNITLKTDLLNLDTFTSQKFVDNFEENQYLTGDPLTAPFGLGVNISLSAGMIIYNGNQFTNFVYALKSGHEQTFSITDSMRGNLLANITKDQNNYNITLQLNRFDVPGKLLSAIMPLNIEDTVITAQAELSTNGKISYDIWNNLTGDLDLSFDGGILNGMGIDNFYANAQNITSMNAENAIANAIESGKSKVKKIRLIGTYNHGDFISTKPFVISMYRADAAGKMEINSGKMMVDMNLVLRGTSPSPDQINIKISPDGKRNYSLSQIMTNFDPDFLRDFADTHEKF